MNVYYIEVTDRRKEAVRRRLKKAARNREVFLVIQDEFPGYFAVESDMEYPLACLFFAACGARAVIMERRKQ